MKQKKTWQKNERVMTHFIPAHKSTPHPHVGSSGHCTIMMAPEYQMLVITWDSRFHFISISFTSLLETVFVFAMPDLAVILQSLLDKIQDSLSFLPLYTLKNITLVSIKADAIEI